MALKSFRDRNPITVGLTSLTVLALAVAASFLTGTLGLLEDRYTMSGVFSDTGGLRSGDAVLVAGVHVGEVTEVRPDFGQGRVVIEWTVDRGVALGPSTRAEIRMSNILGGKFLRLGGPVAAPHLEDLPADRRRIPIERTATPVTVNDVLNSGAKALSELDTEMISKLLGRLDGVSARDGERLGRALTGLTALAETVNESDPQIGELLDNGDRLLRLVNAKDRQLSRLARDVRVLLDQLRDRQAELSVLLGAGSGSVRELSRLISAKQGELIDVVDDLGGTLETLEPQIAGINDMLAWAGPTMTGFHRVSSYGPWIDTIFSQVGPLTAKDVQDLANLLRTRRAAR